MGPSGKSQIKAKLPSLIWKDLFRIAAEETVLLLSLLRSSKV